MDKIAGTEIDKIPFADIRKVADLTYFDGPLLSLFRDFEGQSFLYHWCDSDDTCNRWLVFQITEQQLGRYISKSLTLREVITEPVDNQTFVVNIDGEGNHLSVVLTTPELLPADYLPCAGTLYDPSTTVFL